jgi:hypothetical protein
MPQDKSEKIKQIFQDLIEQEFGRDWMDFARWMENKAFECSSVTLYLDAENLNQMIADYFEQISRYSFLDQRKNIVSFEEIVEKNYSSLCMKEYAEEMFWALFPDYRERD